MAKGLVTKCLMGRCHVAKSFVVSTSVHGLIHAWTILWISIRVFQKGHFKKKKLGKPGMLIFDP